MVLRCEPGGASTLWTGPTCGEMPRVHVFSYQYNVHSTFLLHAWYKLRFRSTPLFSKRKAMQGLSFPPPCLLSVLEFMLELSFCIGRSAVGALCSRLS